MNHYWTPPTKRLLIDWLKARYPHGHFRAMKKAQLYAIFFKEIRKLTPIDK